MPGIKQKPLVSKKMFVYIYALGAVLLNTIAIATKK